MFSPAVRLAIAVLAVGGGLSRLIVALRSLLLSARAKRRHEPVVAAHPIWTQEVRQQLLDGALIFVTGAGLALGPPYLGYAALLDVPLGLFYFIWLWRRLRRLYQRQNTRS